MTTSTTPDLSNLVEKGLSTYTFYIDDDCHLETATGGSCQNVKFLVFPGDQLIFANRTHDEVRVYFGNTTVTGVGEIPIKSQGHVSLTIPSVVKGASTVFGVRGWCETMGSEGGSGDPEIKVGDWP